jgi:hypothetical protein
MEIVCDTHGPPGVHQTGEQYLASRVRICAEDNPNRAKEGNRHCFRVILGCGTGSYREPEAKVEDAVRMTS